MIHVLVDHVENAVRNIRRHRSRTVLTVLGIMIGVASVTCILAISSGVLTMISGGMEGKTDRLIVVRPEVNSSDPNLFVNPIAQQSFQTSTLRTSDVNSIRATKGVSKVAPIMTISTAVGSADEDSTQVMLLATSPDFIDFIDVGLKSGQFFDADTNDNTVVVGSDLALDLFGTDKAVGEVLTLGDKPMTVVGVIKRLENPINFTNVDLNHAVIANIDKGLALHDNSPQIQQINVLVQDGETVNQVRDEIADALLVNHADNLDFSVLTGSDISKPSSQLFSAVASVMVLIAGISLVVGGIGVMNIMLVGVAESTREIGVRKALGASSGTIVTQFLLEALIISFLGGLLGFLFGYASAFGLSLFLYFTPVFTWESLLAAALMSLGVGVVFGLYPAIRAARKNTIEILRQYH